MIEPRRRMALSCKKWSSFWVWVNWGFGFSYSVAHILPAQCKMRVGGGRASRDLCTEGERLYKLAVQLTTLLSSSVSWEGGREANPECCSTNWRHGWGQACLPCCSLTSHFSNQKYLLLRGQHCSALDQLVETMTSFQILILNELDEEFYGVFELRIRGLIKKQF